MYAVRVDYQIRVAQRIRSVVRLGSYFTVGVGVEMGGTRGDYAYSVGYSIYVTDTVTGTGCGYSAGSDGYGDRAMFVPVVFVLHTTSSTSLSLPSSRLSTLSFPPLRNYLALSPPPLFPFFPPVFFTLSYPSLLSFIHKANILSPVQSRQTCYHLCTVPEVHYTEIGGSSETLDLASRREGMYLRSFVISIYSTGPFSPPSFSGVLRLAYVLDSIIHRSIDYRPENIMNVEVVNRPVRQPLVLLHIACTNNSPHRKLKPNRCIIFPPLRPS
ncbi:hypothetical protein BDQ17DRAFT_548877 [Cyathus striatus]|nr:hypothetical protein BDQ17DRAFT_548877 [Cyathus striatus]